MRVLQFETSGNVKSLSDSALSSRSEAVANKLILLVVLLNSADAVFTSLAIDLGVAEANPVMAAILKLGMTWFLFNKLIVVNLMIMFLGLVGRDYSIGRIGMVMVTCIYSLLSIYHLANLSHLLLTGN